MDDLDSFFTAMHNEAQARDKAWAEKVARDEAALTPTERDLRRRFEQAIFGKDENVLASIWFKHPVELIAMAMAYKAEGGRQREGVRKADEARAVAEPYERAVMILVALWMATRGHEQFIQHFSQPLKTLPIPPLPRGWHLYRQSAYAAMGVPWEPPEVTRIHPEYAPT